MQKAQKPVYRYCFVPECKNTIISAPEKVFFPVPIGAEIRKEWCKVIGRDDVSAKTCLHCCEDHFNLIEDTENLIKYNILKQEGVNITLRLKKGVLPHKFKRQNINIKPPIKRPGAMQNLALIQEALSEPIACSDVFEICELSQTDNYETEAYLLIEESNSSDKVKMEKLSMCRICLVENVRMHAVVNKSLQELYEKLTDIPFVTEDSRPMLACFFCCAKIKQCAQFQRKCLEAEQLFAQMLNEDPEPNPSLNRDQLVFSGGYVTTPVQLISIDAECQEESDIIKQEPPDVCKRQHYIIEPKEEYQSDELKLKHIHNRYSDVEGIAPHQSESEDIQPQYSQEDSEDKFTFIEFKTEVVEDHDISTEEQRTREMIWVPDVMVSRLDLEATQPEDTITYKQQENEQLDLGRDQNTQNLTSKLVPKLVKNLVQQNDYKCNICKRIFGNKANLTIHMRTHTGEKPFNCNICQRNFSQSGHLKAHIKIHTGEKPYKCDICQQTYRQKGYLKNHMRIHTGDTRYKCDICQASFNFRANYTKHLRVHTKIIPYKCNVCQSSFDQECHLKSHLRLHNDVNKRFKCEICQRWFKNETYLRRHIRNHSGKKPYKCDICHRGFRDMANLTGHMRTHTGEKPFICDICQRGFRQKVHLTKHIITHTYESSYSCDVCRRSFSRIRYLNMHIRRTHDAEKLFKCDICQRCFRRKSYLGRHIRKHHSM